MKYNFIEVGRLYGTEHFHFDSLCLLCVFYFWFALLIFIRSLCVCALLDGCATVANIKTTGHKTHPGNTTIDEATHQIILLYSRNRVKDEIYAYSARMLLCMRV